jgi:hypothetical protein
VLAMTQPGMHICVMSAHLPAVTAPCACVLLCPAGQLLPVDMSELGQFMVLNHAKSNMLP